MKHYIHPLSNGMRTVFRHTDSDVAHVGLIIGTGSRDEKEDEQGLAHFIEHTIFKGTKKRKAFHILSYLENVGGELNAFTSREETCVYASLPAIHIGRALELLSDVFANSVFPEKEVKKEKDVVIEEIQYYRDLPDESIMDDFDERLFKGHPIGRNILGTPKHIKSFTGKKIRQFILNNYSNERTILSCVGGINPDRWMQLAEKYFSGIRRNKIRNTRKTFKNYQPFDQSVERKINQAHCVLGFPAYHYYDSKRTALALLNNILGGPTNNSRLNLTIRERHGLAYNIESVYTPFSDTGLFAIYMGVENDSVEQAMTLVKKELKKLCDSELGVLQLHRAQQQIIGQIAIANESNLANMLSMGKNLLMNGKIITQEEINRKILDLTSARLQEIANEIFDPKKISSLVYRTGKKT